jgi:hypothetical protein
MTQELQTQNSSLQAAIEEVRNGAQILEAGQVTLAKMDEYGNKLLAIIGDRITTPEQVETVKLVLETAKTRKNAFSESRKPITQAFDLVKAKFIEIEKAMDVATDGSTPNKFKKLLDAKAKEDYEAQQRAEAEAKLKLAREQELTTFKHTVATKAIEYAAEKIKANIAAMEKSFAAATLDTISEMEERLQAWNPVLLYNKWNTEFTVSFNANYLTADDIERNFKPEKAANFEVASNMYTSQLNEFKLLMLSRIFGKKQELQQIKDFEREQAIQAQQEAERKRIEAQQLATAKSIEETQRLAKEIAERDIAEKAKAEAEAQAKLEMAQRAELIRIQQEQQAERKIIEAQKEAQRQADLKRAQEEGLSLFDNAAATISLTPTKSKVKKKVRLKDIRGINAIITHWLQTVGYTLPIEKLEDKLDFMFTAVNKAANDKKPTFLESEFLEYIDDVTAK